MERYDRDRYNNGGYSNQHWYDDDNYDGINYGRDNRYESDRYNRYDHDDGRGHELKQQFERDYRSLDYRDNDNRSNRNGFRGDNDRGGRFRNYRSNDEDRDTGYAKNFMEEQRREGNIRQGYGISSFDGTSDRYNTLNSDQGGNNMQEAQPYYSGSRDRLSSTRYGGGIGDEFPNSNRGVPNYGIRHFGDEYGADMGSSYGGKNYGPGIGYESGN
ncbi:hypothetical protein ACFS7Z_15820 [Pontibacter toksunensis]|uniref:SWFGD domain-containing protein n=1 Tax=Pontibacter toksunensis TaxID=1332631 RepID=A0ABW6BXY7_9BACT